jgi:hypothetical protein
VGNHSPFLLEKEMAEQKKWKCIGECKKEFAFGDWECFPGVNHEVEEKTYYLNDAPHCDFKLDPNGIALRSSRNNVYVLPSKRIQDETGVRFEERAPVLFVMGRYSTRNPEIQYFMERAKIDVGYDRWYDAYHTPTQKMNIKENQLRERERALNAALEEKNELLAKKQAELDAKEAELAKGPKKEKATA